MFKYFRGMSLTISVNLSKDYLKIIFFRETITFNYACKIKVNFMAKNTLGMHWVETAVLQSFYSDIWISEQNSIFKAFKFFAWFSFTIFPRMKGISSPGFLFPKPWKEKKLGKGDLRTVIYCSKLLLPNGSGHCHILRSWGERVPIQSPKDSEPEFILGPVQLLSGD